MPDITTIGVTGAAGAASAYLLKDGVAKLLGPTCDYLGGELKTCVEKRHRNPEKILAVAIKRVGSKIDEPGEVPPRILRDVLNDGSWMEDALSAEYFGGLLACSRSDDPNEETSFNFLQSIKRLAQYQIRLHYVLYSAAKILIEKRKEQNNDSVYGSAVFIPFLDLSESLNIPESFDRGYFLHHSTRVLMAENLIDQLTLHWGSPDHFNIEIREMTPLGRVHRDFGEYGGLIFPTTSYGIDLFMHVHGLTGYGRDRPWDRIFPLENFDLRLSDGVAMVEDLPIIEP